MSGGAGGERTTGVEDLGAVELVAVARVAKARGIRGEVAADLLTDFPERFDHLEELIAVFPGGGRRRLALEDHWLHGDRVVLKFKGFDTPEEAAALAGCELAVAESDAVELEEGAFYDWQLEGCRVETVEGRQLGAVSEVLHAGGEAPVLIIRDERGVENLVPLALSICVEIDIGRKLIRVDAPEGLLEF
ncbi:MAG TPA: ribosome maturation factor RimM [Pyrinomonadaceae bacterium]|jgi:16S rRNA processing protein RimM|nr:ribosome maturation factor RimM [Pyrinomonadaceae bacterium]